MDYEQFLEQVRADLQQQFPYMNVEIRSVEKLQGQSYTGISITPEGSNAGATMNLHSQYEMLQDGVPMDIVMRRIENFAADAVNQIPQVEASTLSDYEQMKHTLIMQAVPETSRSSTVFSWSTGKMRTLPFWSPTRCCRITGSPQNS